MQDQQRRRDNYDDHDQLDATYAQGEGLMYEWNRYAAANEEELIVLLNRLERSEEMPDYIYAPTPERQTWLVLARKLANRNRPARGAEGVAEVEAENVED